MESKHKIEKINKIGSLKRLIDTTPGKMEQRKIKAK